MVYRQRRILIPLCCLALSLLLLLLSTQTSKAASVEVTDDANVLNVNAIKQEATNLSHPIFIFTAADFPLDPAPGWMKDEEAKAKYQKTLLPSKFDIQTRDSMNEHEADIAIGIDTRDRYVSIQSKDEVRLSNTDAKNAVSTFKAKLANNDYNAALLATLKNINNTIAKNENAHAWDNVWNTVKCVGGIALLLAIIVMSKVFGWNTSNSNRRYHHHSSYHSSSSHSSSSSSDSGGSGGGAGGFF